MGFSVDQTTLESWHVERADIKHSHIKTYAFPVYKVGERGGMI